MLRDYLGELETRISREWGHLGEQVTASGTHCIGHLPQVGPAAWLHRFYAGCPEGELDAVEQSMGRRIPLAWRSVLNEHNGLGLFVARLFLAGVIPAGQRRRSIEDPQPFSLETVNGVKRPRGTVASSDDFVIGGRTVGVPCVFLLRPDDSVMSVTRDGSEVLSVWPSAEEMLAGEYVATCQMHDSEGRLVVP
jgi:hypothetical protein